jgi:hypothetical protein
MELWEVKLLRVTSVGGFSSNEYLKLKAAFQVETLNSGV